MLKLIFTFYLLAILGMYNTFLLSQENSYSHKDSKNVPYDQKLIELMNYTNGVFIEVGAYDGLTQSNTLRLEAYYGWTGVLIEPSRILFRHLCNNRPHSKCFPCALGSFSENNTFGYGDFDGGLMSSMDGQRLDSPPIYKVPIRSLQSILDELGIQHVNFFSLDTEGYELNVLQGIDFDKTTFDYLLVEIVYFQYDEIVSFLLNQGYEMIENFSNFNVKDNPAWDGAHDDYLFKRIPCRINKSKF